MCHGQGLRNLSGGKLGLQGIALALHRTQGLRDREFERRLLGFELRVQGRTLCVLARRRFQELCGGLRFGQGHRALALRCSGLKPFVQLLLNILGANLLEQVGITGLVNLEGLVAVGADDFVHGGKEWD